MFSTGILRVLLLTFLVLGVACGPGSSEEGGVPSEGNSTNATYSPANEEHSEPEEQVLNGAGSDTLDVNGDEDNRLDANGPKDFLADDSHSDTEAERQDEENGTASGLATADYLLAGLLATILLVSVVAVLLLLRSQAHSRKVLAEMAGLLHRVSASVERSTDYLKDQSVRKPGEPRSPGVQEFKPEFNRLVEMQGETVSAIQTIQAGLEQLRAAVAQQPKQTARELDQLQTARELREKETRKLAFIAEIRQSLAGLDRAAPPLSAIARVTARILDASGSGAGELAARLEPFVKFARGYGDIERRLKEFQATSGPESQAMQDSITDSVAALAQDAKKLQLKLPVFFPLLDIAGRVPGRTADRQELMRLLGVAETRPKRGEVLTDREQFEIARDLGQGRQMVVESVELCGYKDQNNNTTLRKPRVVVQRRPEA